MSSPILTPARIAFLKHLAEHGETRWARMPATPNGRPVTNQTFRPLAAAGLIIAEYKQPDWRYCSDWHFAITAAGRAAIAEAQAVPA